MKKLIIEIDGDYADFSDILETIVRKINQGSTHGFEEKEGEKYSFEIKDE